VRATFPSRGRLLERLPLEEKLPTKEADEVAIAELIAET
jgi:hypothetical protein